MPLKFWADARRPREHASGKAREEGDHDPKGIRSVFQQDFDRLLFSTPVRRLADKTQVWPMDENDGVRTRLTHSHEVANLARSIGTRVFHRAKEFFGHVDLNETIQPILSAIGLAHDLGNPPFGHRGEVAISDWFEARKAWIFNSTRAGEKVPAVEHPVPGHLWPEFTKFDGNPQSLRLLTTLQTHHARVGLDLSAATLAAVLKYPVHISNRNKAFAQAKKGGYFESERGVVDWIRSETGLNEGQRHPLTWIMEACDDIAYSVLDVDDLLKKGVLSPDDVLVVLRHRSAVRDRPDVQKLDEKFKEVNDSDRRAEIRHDIKIQYLRAYMIEALINDASDAFVNHASDIMGLKQTRALMDDNPLCDALKDVARQYGFSHPVVLRTEALGAASIDGLMSGLWEAISERETPELRSGRKTARARYIFALISPNYVEAAEAAPALGLRYRELRLLTDMVSGMTDGFATKLWRDISTVPHADRP